MCGFSGSLSDVSDMSVGSVSPATSSRYSASPFVTEYTEIHTTSVYNQTYITPIFFSSPLRDVDLSLERRFRSAIPRWPDGFGEGFISRFSSLYKAVSVSALTTPTGSTEAVTLLVLKSSPPAGS